MAINFFFEDVPIFDFDKLKIINWLLSCIKNYNKKSGDLNYIFCNDSYLLSINQQYLNHDFFTDIITFDYSNDNLISGDIYISIDRVKENAISFNVTFKEELFRVFIHGILHLCGLKDKTQAEKDGMRSAENVCLGKILGNF